MDDLGASGEIIGITLRELERINLLLGGNRVTLDGIARLHRVRALPGDVSIADVGCGSGDMLRLMRRELAKNGIDAALTGIDANPNIVEHARRATDSSERIEYMAVNIFDDAFRQRQFDIITGTLFFHHFTRAELVDFFTHAKRQARIGIVVNDIHRHWFAFHSIKWLTRLFSRSQMVRNDAPLSVSRAFKKNELEDILRASGFENYSIRWMWAFRWQVVVDFRT